MIRLLAIVTLVGACGGGSSTTPASSQPQPRNVQQPASSPPPGTALGAPNLDASVPPVPSPTPAPASPPLGRAHAGHSHCGWIGADTAESGVASFMANPDWFDAIHPKWFTLDSDGNPGAIAFTDDVRVSSAARAHGVKLMPLIDADSADLVRLAMEKPAAHAQAIVALAMEHGYDGIELDYEHLWTIGDRPGFTALVQAVAAALHAQGKQLSLALPALWRDGNDNGYDYAALQQSADVIHLMGYDYHWLSGPHLGPIAPKGWVANVIAHVQSLGAPQKYVLGVANYGIGSGWYTTGADSVAQCGNYSRQTDHMSTCDLGQHEEAGLAPHCTTQKGDLWFEDAASVAEKAALAKAGGLSGMSYWTVGAEAPGFFDAVSAQYP